MVNVLYDLSIAFIGGCVGGAAVNLVIFFMTNNDSAKHLMKSLQNIDPKVVDDLEKYIETITINKNGEQQNAGWAKTLRSVLGIAKVFANKPSNQSSGSTAELLPNASDIPKTGIKTETEQCIDKDFVQKPTKPQPPDIDLLS